MAPPPIVTGLSPNEGPPGTRIKIRGENFGSQPSDLIGLTICGMDCLLTAEWKTPNKVIAISGPIKGKGDVIVTTKYGGTGTCNVTFRGYHLATIGPLKESAVWVEETPIYSWGRHSLSPSSFQQEDPLGLSVEEAENKISEEELLGYFPGKCGDIGSQHFSPAWFLLENHQTTSFNDLKAGLNHLTRKVQSQKEGQLSFLKANLNSVMDQIDTLTNLREKYEKESSVFGSTPTIKLERAIKESEREARKLFDDVLARKDRAEKTRNALNVLQRYKFLFCLPCVIERNVKKGDYDIVINDYMRVKNLFDKTEVPIFREALNEVEKRIVELQTKLHKDLQTMPITVEQQKRLIRYLVNLECPFDAAWDAIKSRWEYINQKFKEIYTFHKSTDKSEASKKQNSASKYSKSQIEVNIVPACVNFTDEICVVTSEIFPDLWKIGQAYFSGELQVKIEAGRQVEYKHMVLTAIESFSKYVRVSIIPNTLDKSDRVQYGSLTTLDRDEVALYLPELLRSVRSTYSTLIQLDLPNEALDIVSALLIDMRIYCMSTLFQQTAEQIKQLSENWKINFSGKYTGVTELPLKFLRLIEDVIQIVKESALSVEQRETSLLDSSSAQKELEKQVDNILGSFYDVLNNLSSTEDYDDCDDNSPVVSQLIGTPVGPHKTGAPHDIPTWENRLLITLSNCIFTKITILDEISKKFRETGFSSIDGPIKTNKNKYEALEKSILDKYLEQKSDPLVGTIEPSMYLGRFDWDINVPPTDIRPYAKECVNNLISVHSEINNISVSLLDSILVKIVETIAEELYRLMSCAQKFSKEGAQQAVVDIECLQWIFTNYLSENAKSYFKEALGHVPEINKSDKLLVEDILKQCKVRMKTQILCLRKK
ncbi:exocyst complex component 2 [Diabrotica virgifera virgifera]|uniref:Exocyst complex component 2 n=1 Tax=Diabrotica virgifera virgifera TaxID=50390 RepID=A0ABM5IPJ4_DIAVI|nr:exocyst complex component 2 [Diabrotica virgifera virgifera]